MVELRVPGKRRRGLSLPIPALTRARHLFDGKIRVRLDSGVLVGVTTFTAGQGPDGNCGAGPRQPGRLHDVSA